MSGASQNRKKLTASIACPLWPRQRPQSRRLERAALCQFATSAIWGKGLAYSNPSPLDHTPRKDWNETSPSQILASGRGRCRAAGPCAHRTGGDLSVAAGALGCWVWRRRITARDLPSPLGRCHAGSSITCTLPGASYNCCPQPLGSEEREAQSCPTKNSKTSLSVCAKKMRP
jgi:hypothetical protein